MCKHIPKSVCVGGGSLIPRQKKYSAYLSLPDRGNVHYRKDTEWQHVICQMCLLLVEIKNSYFWMQQIPKEGGRIQGSKSGKIINVNHLNESLYNNVNCNGLVIYSFHFFIEINIYIQVIGIYILIIK